MSTIWQIKNTERKKLTSDIFTLMDTAGAADWLGPGEAPIILKPNLVVSKRAEGGATTHPEIAGAVIEYLLGHGYGNIAVAEGSWVGDSTERAFKICGYTELQKKYGIPLIDLQKDDQVNKEINGEKYKICRTIAELSENGGSLINLPVLKGHGQTHLTCALKNMKGCIPDAEKRRYHSLGVHRPVALLNTLIKPAFALVDGLNGDPYWEEGGSPEKRDLVLLGRDPVSMDSHACRLLNIDEDDVSYIALAEKLGVGSAQTPEEDIIVIGSRDNYRMDENSMRKNTEIKDWIERITDQRSACSSCFGNLAGALRELYNENPEKALKIKEKSICIGQDFRGTELTAGQKGIGICTSGANRIAGCPPSQQAIKTFLSAAIE